MGGRRRAARGTVVSRGGRPELARPKLSTVVDQVPRVAEDELLVDAPGELGPRSPVALVVRDGDVVGLLSITDVGRLVAPPTTQGDGGVASC